MGALSGFIGGSVGLAVLDAALSSTAAADRVGGAANVVVVAIERLVSPAVPAIGVHGQNTHPYVAAAGGQPAAPTPQPSIAPSTFTTRPSAPPAPVSV